MFLREGRALVDFGKPVSIGIRRSKRVACRFTPYIAISRQTATISTSRSLEVKHLLHHCIRELGIVLTVACSLIEVVGKGIGVHHLRQIHRTVRMASGIRRLVMVIGGPYGFSDEVYARADTKLSLSKMTFSHQIVRAIFAEQIYRAFTILNNEPYHHE